MSTIKFRNEWKYVLSKAELEPLKSRIETIMFKDQNALENGFYEIHSLYFDDLHDSALMENNAGISERFKYRIRYYGNDISTLRLEKKIKKNGMCRKESCKLTIDQYKSIVDGDASDLLYRDCDRLLKMFIVDILNKGYSPKIIIDYVRYPFVSEIGNVRITFDENIEASFDTEEFLSGNYAAVPVMDANNHVLEIKFDEILPGYIRHTVDGGKLVQTSNSKYYMGRKRLSLMHL